jgi:hypothetical protein
MREVEADVGAVISGFYDAALGRSSWEDALRLATPHLGAHAATFSSHDPVTRQSLLNIGIFGADDAFSESYRTTYSAMSARRARRDAGEGGRSDEAVRPDRPG